jgi:hypothetical protein
MIVLNEQSVLEAVEKEGYDPEFMTAEEFLLTEGIVFDKSVDDRGNTVFIIDEGKVGKAIGGTLAGIAALGAAGTGSALAVARLGGGVRRC